MSMLMTVLLIAAASSMSVALIQQSQVETGNVEAKTAISGTRHAADQLLAEAEAALLTSPDLPLYSVLPNEASRVCLQGTSAGSLFSEGDVWPASCGTAWEYLPVSGGWSGSRLEYRMPDSSSDALVVTARVRFGNGTTHAATGSYVREAGGKVALAEVYDTGTSVSVEVTMGSGSVYTGATALQVLPSAPTPSSIAAAASQVEDVACAIETSVSAPGGVASLCVSSDEVLSDSSGATVVVPGSIGAYMVSMSGGLIDVSYWSSYDPAVSPLPAVDGSIGQFSVPQNGAIWFDQPVVLGAFDVGSAVISVGSPSLFVTDTVSGNAGFHSTADIGLPAHNSGNLSLQGLFSAGSGIVSYLPSGSNTLSFDGMVVLGAEPSSTCGSWPTTICGYSTIGFMQGDLFTGPYWGAPLGGDLYRIDRSNRAADGVSSDWLRYSGTFASWDAISGLVNTGHNSSATLNDFTSTGAPLSGGASPSVSGLGQNNSTVVVLCSDGTVSSSAATYTCASESAIAFTTSSDSFNFSAEATVLEIAVFDAVLTAEEISEVSSAIVDRWSWVPLYAQWGSSFTVSFDSLEGTTVPAMTCNYGATIIAPATTRTGHAFAGWNTAADGTGVSYAAGATVPCAAITLYAQWDIITFTVSFNSQGGTTVSDMTCNSGATITAPSTTRTGHGFTGWNTAANGSGTSYAAGATVPCADTTLYAQWVPHVTLSTDYLTPYKPFISSGYYGELATGNYYGPLTITNKLSFSAAASASVTVQISYGNQFKVEGVYNSTTLTLNAGSSSLNIDIYRPHSFVQCRYVNNFTITLSSSDPAFDGLVFYFDGIDWTYGSC